MGPAPITPPAPPQGWGVFVTATAPLCPPVGWQEVAGELEGQPSGALPGHHHNGDTGVYQTMPLRSSPELGSAWEDPQTRTKHAHRKMSHKCPTPLAMSPCVLHIPVHVTAHGPHPWLCYHTRPAAGRRHHT